MAGETTLYLTCDDKSQSNTRQDQYGGDAERRARIVLQIIHQIRDAVPSTFCIGIKLNSADYGTSEFEDTMTQIRLFSEAGVDFLEISGGTYEDPIVRAVYDIFCLRRSRTEVPSTVN